MKNMEKESDCLKKFMKQWTVLDEVNNYSDDEDNTLENEINNHTTNGYNNGTEKPTSQCTEGDNRPAETQQQQNLRFKCKKCLNAFQHKTELLYHPCKPSEHLHTCTVCGESFDEQSKLEVHATSHLTDVGTESFVTNTKLNLHTCGGVNVRNGNRNGGHKSTLNGRIGQKLKGGMRSSLQGRIGSKVNGVVAKGVVVKGVVVKGGQKEVDERHPCTKCKMQFLTEDKLREHLKVHRYDSPTSGKECNDGKGLILHTKRAIGDIQKTDRSTFFAGGTKKMKTSHSRPYTEGRNFYKETYTEARKITHETYSEGRRVNRETYTEVRKVNRETFTEGGGGMRIKHQPASRNSNNKGEKRTNGGVRRTDPGVDMTFHFCDRCNNRFPSKHLLLEHKRKHSPDDQRRR